MKIFFQFFTFWKNLPQVLRFLRKYCFFFVSRFFYKSLIWGFSTPNPLDVRTYVANSLVPTIALNGETEYGLFYQLTNDNFMSKVYEEYLIFDAIGMIGSVGGTLGMFIGFSMIGVISWIFRHLKKCHLVSELPM